MDEVYILQYIVHEWHILSTLKDKCSASCWNWHNSKHIHTYWVMFMGGTKGGNTTTHLVYSYVKWCRREALKLIKRLNGTYMPWMMPRMFKMCCQNNRWRFKLYNSRMNQGHEQSAPPISRSCTASHHSLV